MKARLRLPASGRLAGVVLASAALGSAQLPTTRLTHPFYVQSAGIPGTPAEKVNLIADAGYAGIMWEDASSGFSALLTRLQQRNQKLLGIWRNPKEDIGADLAALQSAGEFVFLYIPNGSVTSEADAVANVARVADLLAPSGRKVAIYPHDGLFVYHAAQAVRIAKLSNRPNVGISFNQYHELRYCLGNKLDFTVRADSLLRSSLPHILVASISGSDSVGSGVASLIRPLGEGNFDTFALVKMFVERGFRGSFMLQAYGLPQNPATHLAKSMSVWKDFQKRLPAVLKITPMGQYGSLVIDSPGPQHPIRVDMRGRVQEFPAHIPIRVIRTRPSWIRP